MARPEKVAEVQAITEKLQAAQSMVLADYSGLSVEQMTIFRSQCRSQGVECRVVKNRLAKIAAGNADLEILKEHLTGPTALIFGPASQVDPAKVVVDFAKDNKAMEVKGGLIDGQYLNTQEVLALAEIPSRDELYAKMMGSMQSPATGVTVVLGGVTAALARVIDAVAKQNEAA
jgi:large subunit ribosomal protein L10